MAKNKPRPAAPAMPASPPVPGQSGSGPGNAKKQSALREGMDFILMICGAVLIALLIKGYVGDVYLIPSGSMETALHGRPDGGDRILCSKQHYRFRDLKRWEVAVFEFPYESARRSDAINAESYKGQNFVKRVVGLPGEALAIARGDVWTRPLDRMDAEYARAVKPDSVQRGMWQAVYAGDFPGVRPDEFEWNWKAEGGGRAEVEPGGPLVVSPPAAGWERLVYRPKVPAGDRRDRMVELPGIPDRYVLEQPVQFRCRAPRPDGGACGHVFAKTFSTHNILAHCPACDALQDETAALFYHRRSGLPELGAYAVRPENAPQGEEVSPRRAEYHFVPDLRVTADVTLKDETSLFSIILSEGRRRVEMLVTADGRLELIVNGAPSAPQARAVTGIGPGKRHRVEFYLADGVGRVFVDSAERALLDLPVWNDKRPYPAEVPQASGVALAAAGGMVAIDHLAIDRDIFYYSGRESPLGENFHQMNYQGETFVNDESFFPMGDHCPSSYDARSWGSVALSLLKGPALLVWWPPERFGVIAAP